MPHFKIVLNSNNKYIIQEVVIIPKEIFSPGKTVRTLSFNLKNTIVITIP